MSKLALVVCLVIVSFGAKSQSFSRVKTAYEKGPRVLAFSEVQYGRMQVKVKRGTYLLKAFTPDSVFTMAYSADDVHPLYTFRGDLRLNRAGCDSIVIESEDTIVMRVLKGKNWSSERPYTGKLVVRPNLIYLEAIVRVPIEKYIAGVVEAEGGLSPEPEYHKAQAVLARTWLMSNMKKHIDEGYHVKDDQSSQAFKGVAHGKNAKVIQSAVLESKDTLALFSGKPIQGFYHSNSGGYTTQPHLVWSQELPYFRTVLDPFSLKGSKYTWEKSLDWKAWSAYWSSLGVNWSKEQWSSFLVALPEERLSHWKVGEQRMKLETVRRHFKLRSGYFRGSVSGEKVLLTGKGFGHGVGMSQEGAMHMAASDFTWKEILDFYFKDLTFGTPSSLK